MSPDAIGSIVFWLVLLAVAFVAFRRWRMRRLRRDPRAFHAWAVDRVQRALHNDTAPPAAALAYFAAPADKAWALAAGYDDNGYEIQGIEAAEKLGVPPLLRLQIILEPTDRGRFVTRFGDRRVSAPD